MAETLASRVGRIVSGGLNALVGAVENAAPEVVMREAIREVEAATDEVRAELGKVLARKHLATTRLMEENRQHEELAAQIELALKESREDLAEAAIAKQLDIEAQIPVLERSIAECGEEEGELEGFISALQGKKRQMSEELAQFSATRASATAGPSAPVASNAAGSVQSKVDRASAAFDRTVLEHTGLPGTPDSLESGAKLAELEDLSRKHRIQERLAAAKARAET